jgi:exonuclease SbcD
VTDQVRPLDGMRRLQERFPWCVKLEHRPSIVADAGESSYAERMHQRTDGEIVTGFLELVRNGVGPSAPELALINDVITETVAREAQK